MYQRNRKAPVKNPTKAKYKGPQQTFKNRTSKILFSKHRPPNIAKNAWDKDQVLTFIARRSLINGIYDTV